MQEAAGITYHTIHNTAFDKFRPQEYLDEDDCLDLFDEVAEGGTELPLERLQALLAEEGKDYDLKTLELALALINKEHYTSVLRKDFPLVWFSCTCFDARDCEQIIFLVFDEDREMGLTQEQYMRAMEEVGFTLSADDVMEIFAQLADGGNGRLAYDPFHQVIEGLFRPILAM